MNEAKFKVGDTVIVKYRGYTGRIGKVIKATDLTQSRWSTHHEGECYEYDVEGVFDGTGEIQVQAFFEKWLEEAKE